MSANVVKLMGSLATDYMINARSQMGPVSVASWPKSMQLHCNPLHPEVKRYSCIEWLYYNNYYDIVLVFAYNQYNQLYDNIIINTIA
jgi:hypothetical protein